MQAQLRSGDGVFVPAPRLICLGKGIEVAHMQTLYCAHALYTMLQVLIVQFGGDIFSTKPLSAQQWAACTGIGAITLLVRAVLRLLPPHANEQSVPESR